MLFSGLSFSLSEGQILQVAGANGSGKTTLLRMVCGLSDAYEGEIRCGYPNQREGKEERATLFESLVYIGHRTGVNTALTPVENLRWSCRLQAQVGERDILQALGEAGLGGFEYSRCHNLSAGQQQRVALTRLLLSPARLWVLDEPFTALDGAGSKWLEYLLRRHAGQGGAVIVSSHQGLEIPDIVRLNLDGCEQTSPTALSANKAPQEVADADSDKKAGKAELGKYSLTGPPLPLSSTWSAFLVTVVRELTVTMRRRHEVLNPFMFFFITAALFPLAVTPEPTRLAEIAAGVLWVSALLAAMLSTDSLFRADYEDGSLERLLLSPHPLFFLVLAKNLSHWLLSGLPIVLAAPLIAYTLNLPLQSHIPLLLGLALGTPSLSLLGGIGAALSVGIDNRGLLLTVITLPLCVPVLIAGTLMVQQTMQGASLAGYGAVLAAMALATLCLAPLAVAAALRISAS